MHEHDLQKMIDAEVIRAGRAVDEARYLVERAIELRDRLARRKQPPLAPGDRPPAG